MNMEQTSILYAAMKQTQYNGLLEALVQSAIRYARIRTD